MTEPSELEELRECYEILLKTARRCARDLNHATDNIHDPIIRDMFRERHRNYATILSSTTDYRLELHRTIEILEQENAMLRVERGNREGLTGER